MSAAELREQSTEELLEALNDSKAERFNLRFQIATNQLDNTARLKSVKKEIAQILTILRERELATSSAKPEEVGVVSATPANAEESA